MPLSPPLVLEAGSGTKFQLLPLSHSWTLFGSNQELGGALIPSPPHLAFKGPLTMPHKL